jgi:hypothetical protein
LSDISLKMTLSDWIAFALWSGWPGILFGGATGAVLWRAHRIIGAVLGGCLGGGICFELFSVWSESSISVSVSYWDALTWAGLVWFAPGWCIGAILSALRWRGHLTPAIAGGGAAGGLAGLAGWAVVALW